MLFKIVKYIFFVCVIASCKTVSFNELRPDTPLKTKLPTLEARLDIYSLENAYASVAYGITTTVSQRVLPISEVRPLSYRDAKIQDAIIIYDREVTDNIVDNTGEKKGYILFKILSGGPRRGGNLLGVVGIATLFIPNLLGVPIGNHKVAFEVELSVYDNKNNLVGKYIGGGKHKTWIRIGGYSAKDAQRIANIRALKKAFVEIKKQMDDDFQKLQSALNNQ